MKDVFAFIYPYGRDKYLRSPPTPLAGGAGLPPFTFAGSGKTLGAENRRSLNRLAAVSACDDGCLRVGDLVRDRTFAGFAFLTPRRETEALPETETTVSVFS